MNTRERISIALKRSNKSQRDLAKHMNISSSAVNRMLGDGIGKEIDSVKYIQAVEDLTGYRFEWLRTGVGPERIEGDNAPDVQSLEFLRGILKSKDDLIKEQGGRIGDLQKLNSILESQLLQLKGEVKELHQKLSATLEPRKKGSSGEPPTSKSIKKRSAKK